MISDPDCIFCKIVCTRNSQCQGVRRCEYPGIHGHQPGCQSDIALVIPKQHWPNLFEMPDALLGEVSSTARKVAIGVQKALNPDGVSLVQANGKGAAQSVLHFHIHIIPRTLGDNLKMNWKLIPGNMDEIRAVAKRLISAID